MSDFRFVARGRPYSSDEIAGAVNRVVRHQARERVIAALLTDPEAQREAVRVFAEQVRTAALGTMGVATALE